MNVKNSLRTVSKRFYSVTEGLVWIAYVALAIIVLVVLIDVFGRYLLNSPLRGSNEIVELAMMILGGFTIMYAALKGGHIAVDVLVCRFPRRTQIILQRTAALLGVAAWAALAYHIYLNALWMLKFSKLTIILRAPEAPFLLACVVALILCCLILLIQAFRPELPREESGEREEL